ncbi:methylated-DNA--[protein]-cysteine S-methyltransferase [Gallaecimonas sp. GXIMD4217]|uniref:methylated-DNA--[protein]-cysteine S-methyltransferase n=1 Tax=Gallaecimonas sp. GXIMD4217 TaxID=3131927 RepID=UPI00311AF883
MNHCLEMKTPLGQLLLVANGSALTAAYFDGQMHHPGRSPAWHDGSKHWVLLEARRQLTEYFAGHRRDFELPLAPKGTDFQQQVWAGLRAIPFGHTYSYKALAEALGRPSAVRAVAAANGRNPLSVIVPCHRVLGASGKLTGYAGGLWRKEALLALEGCS